MHTEYSRQHGAALIVALVLLVIMTILGMTSMNMSILEERMAGNIRNMQLAFDAAEAALRDGETTTEGLPPGTVFDANGGTGGLYVPNTGGIPVWEQGDITNPDTSGGGMPSWQPRGGTSIDGVASQPQSLIEDLGTVLRFRTCAMELPPPGGCHLPVRRVTARGWGANLNAVSVLQSTYKKF